MLELVALRLMCAVAQPHIYSETVVIAACAGGEFTTKGKTVKHSGWKALEDAYRAQMKDAEPKKEGAEKALPDLTEGQTLSVSAAIVKEGKSLSLIHISPPDRAGSGRYVKLQKVRVPLLRRGASVSYTHLDVYKRQVSYN